MPPDLSGCLEASLPAPLRWILAFLAPQSPHALLQSPEKTGHRKGTTLPEITVDLSDVFIDLYVAFLWVKSFLEN
jgi:hypothetical protein